VVPLRRGNGGSELVPRSQISRAWVGRALVSTSPATVRPWGRVDCGRRDLEHVCNSTRCDVRGRGRSGCMLLGNETTIESSRGDRSLHQMRRGVRFVFPCTGDLRKCDDRRGALFVSWRARRGCGRCCRCSPQKTGSSVGVAAFGNHEWARGRVGRRRGDRIGRVLARGLPSISVFSFGSVDGGVVTASGRRMVKRDELFAPFRWQILLPRRFLIHGVCGWDGPDAGRTLNGETASGSLV